MSFALLLARTLGRTLEELQDCMSSAEFGLWAAEYTRRPWGDLRNELHMSMICRTISDYAGRVQAEGKPAKLGDFMLDIHNEPPDPDAPPAAEPDPIAHFNKFK